MTKIKLCGITRLCDIEVANELKPEYIGFVFAKKSKRYVAPEAAARLKSELSNFWPFRRARTKSAGRFCVLWGLRGLVRHLWASP